MSSRHASPVRWIGPAQCAAVRLQPPPLPSSKRRRILPSLLGQHIPFPLDDCAIAFEEQPDGTVMGFAARLDTLASTAPDSSASVRPPRAVPAAWAVWRQALREMPPGFPDEPRAVLCDDPAGTPCLAIGRGSSLHAAASLPLGASPDLASLGLPADTRILRIADPAAFRARALAACRTSLCPVSAYANAGFPRLLAIASMAILLLAAGLFAATERALSSARASAAALDDAFSTRVDLLAGDHVTARGDRALRIALDACRASAADPPSPLSRLLHPGASRALATTLRAAAKHGIHLFHVTIDDAGPALSGDAPDRASVDAFGADSGAEGLPLRIEPDPASTPGERLRFMATPLSSAP